MELAEKVSQLFSMDISKEDEEELADDYNAKSQNEWSQTGM